MPILVEIGSPNLKKKIKCNVFDDKNNDDNIDDRQRSNFDHKILNMNVVLNS